MQNSVNLADCHVERRRRAREKGNQGKDGFEMLVVVFGNLERLEFGSNEIANSQPIGVKLPAVNGFVIGLGIRPCGVTCAL